MLIRFRNPARFFRDKSSIESLELAIVLPLMLILLAGVYDFSEALIVRAEVYDAADVMAASASALAVQQDGSTALTYDQVQLVESSIWALVPTLRGDRAQSQGNPKSVTISSVLFFPELSTPCGVGTNTSCKFIADVAWSEAYAGGAGGAYGTFQANIASSDCSQDFGSAAASPQVAATATLSGTNNVSYFRTLNVATDASTFPAQAGTTTTQVNEAGVAPILVVSIQYTYTPLFNFYILQPYTFWVDGYWPVRSVKAVAPRPLNGLGITVEPLANQFTTLVGTGYTPSGSDVNSSDYCVNHGVSPSPISAPVT